MYILFQSDRQLHRLLHLPLHLPHGRHRRHVPFPRRGARVQPLRRPHNPVVLRLLLPRAAQGRGVAHALAHARPGGHGLGGAARRGLRPLLPLRLRQGRHRGHLLQGPHRGAVGDLPRLPRHRHLRHRRHPHGAGHRELDAGAAPVRGGVRPQPGHAHRGVPHLRHPGVLAVREQHQERYHAQRSGDVGHPGQVPALPRHRALLPASVYARGACAQDVLGAPAVPARRGRRAGHRARAHAPARGLGPVGGADLGVRLGRPQGARGLWRGHGGHPVPPLRPHDLPARVRHLLHHHLHRAARAVHDVDAGDARP
mmetsp:Transcript_4854/g.15076  ORF Transcript_4854/g.15076 Transcript_4854/m.15076 type:complete len:312 (-) Transcript_4854:1340-2275(-)